ncbi:diaminopimelate epimerase [Lactobacillus sp. S2-2]|uniref:diaminopimelate epimerase n=1 Tax=Lactobacillus sp. S2-2 TaxID=2692917 RepID=UPI001F00FC24|nr:diaminopimelate epimerase [Lactobacillus sp. S2-2]MCF6514920.1 diaminopimelate epimerase [Lactobacillus sp. S2-2]
MTELLKVHGSENQFFILDRTKLEEFLSDKQIIELTKRVTNRTNGLLGGADGLLLVDNSSHKDTLGQMRVINADGSEASMCGNGLRTVSRYLSEKFNQTHFKVETMNADLEVKQAKDLAPNVKAFSVEISPVKFNQEAFPFEKLNKQKIFNETVPEIDETEKFTAIAVPNPHLINFSNNNTINTNKMEKLGKYLNGQNPYFTDGVNLNFAYEKAPNQIFVKTFERGVGFTNACGTGMTATSLAYALINYPNQNFNEEITVYNPGGMVKNNVKKIDNHYSLKLTGNATITHKINIDLQSLINNDLNKAKIFETNEESDYKNFVNSLT